MSEKVEECTFSITLSDRDGLREFSMADKKEEVTLWGSIGEIVEVGFVEDLVLQIKGRRGVMELGITRKKLSDLISLDGGR